MREGGVIMLASPVRDSWLGAAATEALHADLRTRIHLQRELAQHTSAVLEAEFGVSPSTVWCIVNGEFYSRDNRRVPLAVANEIRHRRIIWTLIRERYQGYTKPALCKKYGVSHITIHRHMHIVRSEMHQEMTARAA